MSNALLPTASAGRRRFWIALLCFAVANAAAWVAYDRYFAWRYRGTLAVVGFEPGEGADVGARPDVRWHFNTDVIPTAAYGRDPGTITPAVSGRWSWDDPRTLRFSPDADLPRATRVTFALDTAFLRSSTGASLARPYTTSVNSTPLGVEEVRQASCIEGERYVIELHFNGRVSPGDVVRGLTVSAGGHNIACKTYGEAAGKTIRILTDPVPPSATPGTIPVVLHIAAGTAGLDGPLGLPSAFDSTINLGRSIAATKLDAFAPPRGQASLAMRFNNTVDLTALKQILSIDPSLPFTLESTYDGVRILGDFQSGTRYTVKLAAAPAGSDLSRFPQPGQLAAFVPDRGSGIWLDNDQGYLSSSGNRSIVAHAMNVDSVRVAIDRVYDSNLVAWRNAATRYRWTGTSPYDRPLATKTLSIAPEKNVQHDIRIALDDLLPARSPLNGVYRITVASVLKPSAEAVDAADSDDDEDVSYSASSTVVTLSDIALTAKQTRGGFTVWATSLRTASPLGDVRIRVFSDKNQLLGEAVTNADGLATVATAKVPTGESAAVVLADRVVTESPATTIGPPTPTTQPALRDPPSDLTWLDLRHSRWELGDSETSGAPYLRTGYSAYVYTDRGVYRPGETVHLHAIVRGPENIAPVHAFPVRWQFRRPDLHDWKSQVVMLDADGAASLDMPMPADVATGGWSANIGLPGAPGSHETEFGSAEFQIEEFVPNRMKVGVDLKTSTGRNRSTETQRFDLLADQLSAEIQGDYLFGRPAAGLEVSLTTRADPTAFRPHGWDGWTFGDSANIAAPAVKMRSPAALPRRAAKDSNDPIEQALDASGHCTVPIDVRQLLGLSDEDQPTAKPAEGRYLGPWHLTASAGVRETGGRTVTVTKQIDVDLLPAYLALRVAEGVTPRPGEPCPMEIGLVRADGSVAANDGIALEATLFRASWNTVFTYRDGRYRYESTRTLEPVSKETVTLAAGWQTWSPKVPVSGSFVASVRDAKTGACTSMEFQVADGSPWDDNISRENPERLEVRILADDSNELQKDPTLPANGASKFSIGDTANVLIASPFAGRLLLTVETDDIVQTVVMDMKASHVVVPVKITESLRPNAFVTATVIRAIDPDAKWRTHRAFGTARLRVDPSDHALHIAIDSPPVLQPLRSLDAGICVTDSDGNPVANTAITVAAVDEGICQLTNFSTPDPLAFFSRDRALMVGSFDVYGLLMPEVPRPDANRAVGGDRGGMSSRHITPVVARRFKPVALAWAQARTDADGLARVSFPVPEFQGQLRLMAVAYNTAEFGSADKPVTVRSPILAQTSWPRFAAPGDRFVVPIVLFNNTPIRGDVSISVELLDDPGTPAGLLSFDSAGQKRIELPTSPLAAGAQQSISLPVIVGQAAGVAKVHLRATMGDDHFDENLELPIRPASPMLQYGGYASASTTQPAALANPTILLSGCGSFHIAVTPGPTLQLPSGLDYLDRYPYGCVEQTTSTCFPLLSLGDIGKQIDPVRFGPDRIRRNVEAGITHLIGMQTSDGGLAMWPGNREDWPWGTVYAAHFLTEARAAGVTVPDDFYTHLMAYVRHLLDASSDEPETLEIQAYGGYVLALAGKADRPALNRLTELASAASRPGESSDGPAMRGDARLFLSCAWMLSGRRDLAEGLIPDALPLPRANRQSSGNIGSPIRDRALLVSTLVMVQPAHPALPDLVQQLADAGLRGQWASTQDTAFAVMAIGHYLKVAQKHAAFESAELRLGETVLARSDGGAPIAWDAPLKGAVASSGPTTSPSYAVKITGAADSTAYVSWLQTGVPLSPPNDVEHGLKIHRRYLNVNGTEIAGKTVRTGDLIRVQIELEAPSSQRNLVIEDLLPAGLEVENPRLLTTALAAGDANGDAADPSRPAAFNANRTDIRDDRVIVAGNMPGAPKARCEYLVRAVTPGTYIVPPVRAEAMYDINTNALSGAGGTLTVLSATSTFADVGH